MKNRLSLSSRIIIVISSLGMIAVLYLPIWRIELTAPQYPEGLVLQIFAHKIGGAVDIVNGLNHYIGMQTLHTRDFVEFIALPYIIGGFLAIGFLVALFSRKIIFYGWYFLFMLIAFTSMIDFYRWEYNYGHNLDPYAPIQVPGMVYQPPLIGYKQLLNFTAYSVPDSGGWIFIGVGALLTLVLILELRRGKKRSLGFSSSAIPLFLLAGPMVFSGCSSGPEPIHYGQDNCDYCKMGIQDKRFGGEVLTSKGKAYKFDDMHCLLNFMKSEELAKKDMASIYFVDFSGSHQFIKSGESFLLAAETLHSPMGGNMAAFESQDSAKIYQQKFQGQLSTWADLYK
ncbi:MAG: nitrous oxide reductase accessory protein NosL [Bacteroidota bacterium]|nr:nitrous oxide reductase accessory protein NosL [Bacteroidota bacterium]MDP4251996.1 nitrous oxide reductase accessory protein NosL [Bacteroidota bacterium]